MDLGLEGKHAIVVASSSGLGKGSARALASEDANVLVNGRDESRLSSTVQELDGLGTGTVVGEAADLTDKEDVRRIVNRAVDEFGGLDCLVTNAGGPPRRKFSEATDEDWYDAFELLVMSTVRLIRNAEDYLRAGDGGSIVNISSKAVKEAPDANVLTSAIRMCNMGLQKTLSRELAPEVRINAVLPALHETPRIQEYLKPAIERGEYDSYDEAVASLVSDIPLRSIGDPDDFGRMVAFLCSPRSDYITGTTQLIDGGLSRSNV